MAKTKIPKSQKKSQAREARRQEEALIVFLRNYGELEPAQDADAAAFDNQVKSITTLLATFINATQQGTIVDVGCGKGILLSRLCEVDAFMQGGYWNYLGVDLPEYKEFVFKLAVDQNIHRKVDFYNLDKFYNEWPQSQSLPRPHIVFIRNVIHELNISDTAHLLEHISSNLKAGEILIIQDLQVFPIAEKGNACWIPEQLEQLIEQCGFNTLKAVEKSRTGNRWYNIVATRNDSPAKGKDEVIKLVLEYRYKQWLQWRDLGAIHTDDEKFRDVRIAKIDFDLQFAALNNQLLIAGAIGVEPLSRNQQALIVKETFGRALSNFNLSKLADGREILEASLHFVNRGNGQDSLEKFLTSTYTYTALVGPTLMGKTELAKHVLAKFHHDRVPVLIDVQATGSVWNILESILSSIRCHVPNEVLASMQQIEFNDIKSIIQNFFEEHSRKLVIVVDHYERLLNPRGQITDESVQDLILLLVKSSDAKVVLTSRREFDPSFIPPPLQFPEPQPPVGRFPGGPPHVEQLLGTLVGIKNCPPALLEAIDRHPMLAVLAGLFLHAKGKEAQDDVQLLSELRNNMRTAIFSRIVDEESRPAIMAISRLRIPVPRSMIVALSSERSVQYATEQGLIFTHRDFNRDDLVNCVGALRLPISQDRPADLNVQTESENSQDIVEDSVERRANEFTAALYEQLYRKDGNPKWLREAFYHQMLTADSTAIMHFGVTFRTEIFGAGEYWFRHQKDFHSALWAFQTAHKYGDNSLLVRMRMASCLIRVKKQKEGEDTFTQLIQEYPEFFGIKTSYIDSLLYIREYKQALNVLSDLQLTLDNGPWVAGQYGRAYLGLQRHAEAVEAFSRQLQLEEEPFTFKNLARAYHQMGNTEQERSVLARALRIFPSDRQLQLAYAALQERIGNVDDACMRLEALYSLDPTNGWIVYPLIKTLVRLEKFDRVEEIWKHSEERLQPEFLRIPIQAVMAVTSGKYEDALSLTKQREEDEHSIGQQLEIYFEWAKSAKDNDEAVRIAKHGIADLAPTINTNLGRNVPVLLSYSKLAIMAVDKPLLEQIKREVMLINPEIEEIDRIVAELKPEWAS
ncbi:MAG TPA: hypothetical protein VJ842_02945 [Pyrinomonadaceae bacterium]|nr:hypothetical protein [Pyrinomonadaceae bacterium]